MKKVLLAIAILFSLYSFVFQERTDLLQLKFDEDITKVVFQPNFKKDKDINKGCLCYSTDKLKSFTIEGVELKTYQYPNGNLADYSRLNIYVSSHDKPKYLGFRYSTVNQEETKLLLLKLTDKFKGQFEIKKQGVFQGYFFDLKDLNAWIFITDGISNDKNGKEFKQTNFLYVKKGLRVENSLDPNYNTILQDFEMSFPK